MIVCVCVRARVYVGNAREFASLVFAEYTRTLYVSHERPITRTDLFILAINDANFFSLFFPSHFSLSRFLYILIIRILVPFFLSFFLFHSQKDDGDTCARQLIVVSFPLEILLPAASSLYSLVSPPTLILLPFFYHLFRGPNDNET